MSASVYVKQQLNGSILDMFGKKRKPKTREIENFTRDAIENTLARVGTTEDATFESCFEELNDRLREYAERHGLSMWGRSVLCGTVEQFLARYTTDRVRGGLMDRLRRDLLT